MNKKLIQITADCREDQSGIPDLLRQKGVEVNSRQLQTGDYIINKTMLIERKSSVDFVLSLITNRLFSQCSRLAVSGFRPYLLLEGDPLKTHHRIECQAVKGAMLSVTASWQIPIITSENRDDSANLLLMLANQAAKQKHFYNPNNYKSKRLTTQRLRFLQGLPDIGSVIAARLIEHFGNIQAIIEADSKELQQIAGIGEKTASKIKSFVTGK